MAASFRSPKNKYQGVINFDEPLEDIGSVVRYTANDLNELKNLCNRQAGAHPCRVTILENKKEYPSFDWQEVERYELNR